jgi:menaquinone-dependent protoporphyrinogen IX oxidase
MYGGGTPMFGKKKTFSQKLQAATKKREKKINKLVKKFLKSSRRSQKRVIKILTKGPAWFELFVHAIFAIVVCYLFWRKAKDPTFLENFGETKL